MTLLSIALYLHRPDPFGNPVVDVFRSLCVVLAVLLVCWTVRVTREQYRRHGRMAPGQLDRFISLGIAAVSIAYTEVVVQGTPLTVRLPVNLAAMFFGFRGLYRMRRDQRRR